MYNGENSSDNPIRIGVENISDGDIDIEVANRVAPATNGQGVLIGVDNHSIGGNNNIKAHDMDLRGSGSARVGAGNYARGSNIIFVGSLEPTNGLSSNGEGPPILPRPLIKPSLFGGRSSNPLPSFGNDNRTRSLQRAPSGPLRSVESDDIGGSSLPRGIRRSATSQFAIATMSTRLPNATSTASQPLRAPARPLPPNPPFSTYF